MSGRALLRSTWTLGFIVLLVTWPVTTLAPATGLDPSWQAALHLAAHHRISFGDDLIFTYGPLGFLNFPQVYYPLTSWLAMLYVVAVRFAIAASLVWAARRTMSLPAAFGSAAVVAGILTFTEDAIVVPVFIWCAAALTERQEGFATRALPVGGGVVAGIEILSKLNIGIAILVMLALTILALPDWRRTLPVFGATFAATALAAWLVMGGSLGQLWPFILNGASIIAGYSSAMQHDDPNPQWWLPLGVAAAAGIGVAGVYSSTVDAGRRRRLVLLLLWAFLVFITFKEGFVRQGPDRKAIFFGTMLGALFAFHWRGRQAAVVLSLAAVLVLYFGASRYRVADVIEPVDRADQAVEQLRTMLRPGRRDELVDETRASMQVEYGLDPISRGLIGDRPVHIYPHEAMAAWAYELNWRPLPAFQTYTAYTERLDELNADALAAREGPGLILRRPEPAIDHRNGAFDSPAAVVAMVCHYDEITATPAWQLLRRIPNRCGPERPITTAETAYGDDIRVPRARPNELVIARVRGIQVSGGERLRSFLYRAREREVAINGRAFRFLPGIAGNSLLLRIPPKADWSSPYGFSAFSDLSPGNAELIVLYRGSQEDGQPDDELRISFSAIPIR